MLDMFGGDFDASVGIPFVARNSVNCFTDSAYAARVFGDRFSARKLRSQLFAMVRRSPGAVSVVTIESHHLNERCGRT
jgi:hypothetical protein